MEEKLRVVLEKFAELERRVRKLAAENRALKDEAASLREKLSEAGDEKERLSDTLLRERSLRREARDRVDGLIEKLEGMGSGLEETADRQG